MAIIREHGQFIVYCDNCEEELDKYQHFDQAVAAVKQAGWKTTRVGETLYNHCPTCYKKE